MNEAQTAQTLREAMRRYSQNSISPDSLGIFKGVDEEGVTVRMQLRGINLRVSLAEVVDVAGYEQKIESLEETVKEQTKEIADLRKEAKKKPAEEVEESESKIVTNVVPSIVADEFKLERRRKKA
jgi:hypothetical protein